MATYTDRRVAAPNGRSHPIAMRIAVILIAVCRCLGGESASAATDGELAKAVQTISAAPKSFHGVYELMVEGDAVSLLLMEVFSPNPDASRLFLIPSDLAPFSGGVRRGPWAPIPLCGRGFEVQSALDSLTISVTGCSVGVLRYRVDVTGVEAFEGR